MIYAERGFPSIGLILATLVGGAFAAGSAGAFNCYIDRDIDKLMHRTENRPLVTGEVTPREALVFSWLLGAAAIAILWFGANPLAAWLGLGAIVFYVVIYTMILKRRTAQNIVWGGAAGCFPVLIAWAAVTNTVEWPAVILFMVIFLWTPPHYWPLSMRYGEDYRNANVPMLGAIAGRQGRLRPGGPLRVGHGGVLAAAGPGRRRRLGLHRHRGARRCLVPLRVARPVQPGAGAATCPTRAP